MRIVMLAGSPRREGSSNTLAAEFIRGARENGHEVVFLDAARMNIHPCLGCERCGMDGECVQKDENSVVREAVLSSDMIVFVTPIYYFGMSAQLKTVVDRFYSYTKRLPEKRLKSALIAAAWNRNGEVMTAAVQQYEKMCAFLGFESVGMVLGTTCGSPAKTRASSHMAEAYALGKAI